jgi:hypothetical protein
MLAIIATIVPTVGHSRVKPALYFSPIAQPISNNPATISRTHGMALLRREELAGEMPPIPGEVKHLPSIRPCVDECGERYLAIWQTFPLPPGTGEYS